jgi:AcrR family transcriptional regulator
MAGTAKPRLTAAQRGEEVLQAAVTAFAAAGYAGTKTDEIARLAGVSQPYVIRLFGTKQQLFLAAIERVCDRIEEAFRRAAREQADLKSLGNAYRVLLAEHELLVVLLHGFTASAEPAIGDATRHRFGRVYDLVRDLTGASVEEARDFLATGMLLTVMAAMRVAGPEPVAEPWATAILDSFSPPGAASGP